MKYYKRDKIVSVTYEDISLCEKCIKIYESIDDSKPDRDYHGIQTWFRYEEGN
jgi:hypothetical protein